MKLYHLLAAPLLTATTFLGSQSVSAEKPDLPKPHATKTVFDKTKADEHVTNLDSNKYSVRELASSELSKIAKILPFNELNDFFIYILDKTSKGPSLEVCRRLERLQETTIGILKQKIIDNKEYSKMILGLIDRMDKKREPHIWEALTPIVVEIISNKTTIIPGGIPNEHDPGGWQSSQKQLDPALTGPLSKLLLSPFNEGSKDSKELQTTAEKQIVSLTGEPLFEQGTFISLYNLRLQALSKSPEAKLGEVEKGLKALKKLQSQTDLSRNTETNIAHAAKPHLEEILKRNIEALATNDPQKQAEAIINITTLKEQFSFPKVIDLISTSNGALIFDNRKELTRNITNAKDLQTSIQVAQSISDLTRTDTNYHKSYVNWLQRAIDNIPKTLPEKTITRDILVSALKEELYAVAQSGKRTPLQAEVIKQLVPTYTKLISQSGSDTELLKGNINDLVDLQYFSYSYLSPAAQEELHPQLLAMFDTLTANINKVQKAEDKSYLKIKLLTTVPRVISFSPENVEKATGDQQTNMKAANRLLDLYSKDYLPRLSELYKGQDTGEFINLTSTLVSLDNQWGQWAQGALPAEMMIKLFRKDFDHFEKTTKQIIKSYNDSNDPNTKALLKGQLERVNLSFQLLFNEEQKTSNAWLGQALCSTKVTDNEHKGNWAEVGWIHLDSRSDLKAQISEIKRLYQERLQEPMNKILIK